MAKEKHFVFSARTTEEGLRLLNGVREERKIGWDDLVIDAVCAHYGLDRLVMVLPKAEKPVKKAASEGQAATEAVGTEAQSSEVASRETTAKLEKTTKRQNKQKGGKKHGKAKRTTEWATDDAAGS